MYNPRFEKARFKKDVQDNVKRLFRKELDEANPQEQFQAVSYAVKKQSLTIGSTHRRRSTKKIRRLCIICPWSS